MTDDSRIQQLLDELIDPNRTPEEVCRSCPELLPVVRERWRQMRRLRADLDALFPPSEVSSTNGDALFAPPFAPTTPPPGATALPHIPGYEVEAVLGRGGMGIVYKARHMRLNRPVALKMLLTGAYASPEERERFLREAKAVAGLRHANIVQVYDLGDHDGRTYFTMEVIEGGNLAGKLAGEPQAAPRAAELVTALARAVQFAHASGIIHRDLKPANVLLLADGTPKISDFGLARRLEAGGSGFTLSGAPLGTPSYMAPEQALGKTRAIGPAADIYALGAILYEVLTGRPPFRAETAVETMRQVIAEEPAPPSRLNAKVPRDLETICLKCLAKNSARRYANAQALADDLHRFLDGKPVLARPVGALERTVKWARRRPGLATLFVSLFVLLTAAAGAGIWIQSVKVERQGRARQAVETAIQGAYNSGRVERWKEALRTLENAATHLPEADSDDLRQGLAQAKTDVEFAQQLEHIREKGVVFMINDPTHLVVAYTMLAEEFGKAFAEAGFNIDGPAQETVERIQALPLAAHTVAALDEWAFAAFILKRAPLQEQLLRIAQLADADPSWRDCFRTPATWHDKAALLQLADDAFKTPLPPAAHHLAITGALLRKLGDKSIELALLRRGWLRHAGDFWLNWELANALDRNQRQKEAVEYFRVVVAMRPDNVYTHNALALVLGSSGHLEEGIQQLRMAVGLEPGSGILRYNLVVLLFRADRMAEAQAEAKKAMEANPGDAWAPYSLGMILAVDGRGEESIPHLQKACQLNPKRADAYCNLGVVLRNSGRLAEALAAFQQAVALEESNSLGHMGVGFSLLNLGRHDEALPEFEWLIRELDPSKIRPDGGDGVDSKYIRGWLGKAESLLCLGRFTEASAAARKALSLPRLAELPWTNVQRQLEMAEGFAPLEAELPAILAGDRHPAELAVQLLLAEWLYKYKRFAGASVRCYESAFEKQPKLADDVKALHRYYAGCAAVLAGCGLSKDAVKLNDEDTAALRGKAQQWLTAERDAWEELHKTGTVAVQSMVSGKMRDWGKENDLRCVRDPEALAMLPEGERTGWKKLWAAVKALELHDPSITLRRARDHVERKEWAKAANIYAQLTGDGSATDGEIWFEYAAVQLLSGDHPGYRQTCKHLLQGAPKAPKFRRYLLARACTLAPDSVEDVALPAQVGDPELRPNSKAFWSLTEQGALLVRANQPKMAVELFRKSLEANDKPGAAVVNWLWLALGHQKLGAEREAREWLEKAVVWLDSVGGKLPADAEARWGLHRHNWLEAHILRCEVEALLSPS